MRDKLLLFLALILFSLPALARIDSPGISGLSAIPASTSADLAGVISDEVGTDKLVFNTNPGFSQLYTSQAIGATSTDGFSLINPTAATLNNQKMSPRIRYSGNGWKTDAAAGSQPIDFITEFTPIQGTASPTGVFSWSYQVNNGGYSPLLALYTDGRLIGTSWTGAVIGNVTGTASNATLAATSTVADASSDTTTFPMLAGSATGSLPILTDAGIAYNASTDTLTVTNTSTALGSSTATTQSANDNSTKVATTAYVDAANLKTKTFFEFTNTGTPTVAQQGFIHRSPCAGTITGWSIGVDAGTATVKFWKKAAGTAVPTSSDSINTSGVAISSGTFINSTTLSDFTTTTVTAGDIFAGEVTAVSGVTKISVQLYGTCN